MNAKDMRKVSLCNSPSGSTVTVLLRILTIWSVAVQRMAWEGKIPSVGNLFYSQSLDNSPVQSQRVYGLAEHTFKI